MPGTFLSSWSALLTSACADGKHSTRGRGVPGVAGSTHSPHKEWYPPAGSDALALVRRLSEMSRPCWAVMRLAFMLHAAARCAVGSPPAGAYHPAGPGSPPQTGGDVLTCTAVGGPPIESTWSGAGTISVDSAAITAEVTGQCSFVLHGTPGTPVALANLTVSYGHTSCAPLSLLTDSCNAMGSIA